MLAHESWFAERLVGYDWAFFFDPITLGFVAAALAVAVVWRLVARRVPSPELPFLAPLGRLAPYVPRLLGVHAGVSLLAQASRETFLAPSLRLPDTVWGEAIAIAEAIIGIWLITGFRLRWPAALLVAAGPVGMFAYGVVPILERIDLLGIALFLVLLPPSDATAGSASAEREHVAPALLSLRVLVGGSLVVLAVTEKLARPDLAFAFLEDYPAFNVFRAIGLDVPDASFVRFAGAMELLFGLLIISGALPQLTVLAAGIPFNATLFFLGAPELIGHLPIYGAMLALLVYGSAKGLAPVTSWRPRRDRPTRSDDETPAERLDRAG